MLRKLWVASFIGSALLISFDSASFAGSKTIFKPMYNGNRLDWCTRWSEDCGQPAADAYCKAQGFVRATWFTPDRHIGARSPTRLIGTGATCDLAHCDGFRQITCLKQPTVNQMSAGLPRANPMPSRIGLAGLARISLTKVASASPMTIAPPIPTPRPVFVATKIRQAEIRVEPAAAEAAAAGSKTSTLETPSAATATADPIEGPKAGLPAIDRTDEPATVAAAVEAANPARAPKIFDKPMYNGRRLAWCHEFDSACGKPAADAFCKANGFSSASEFSLDPHIGDVAPTRSIGSGAVCDQAPCDGFKLIACAT